MSKQDPGIRKKRNQLLNAIVREQRAVMKLEEEKVAVFRLRKELEDLVNGKPQPVDNGTWVNNKPQTHAFTPGGLTAEEQTMCRTPGQYITAIKSVRARAPWPGLRQAKDLVDDWCAKNNVKRGY